MSQEYYYSSVGYCTIWAEIVDKPDMVIVSDGSDYGDLSVVRRSELVPKEESWTYLQQIKRKKELEEITKRAKENIDKIADQAVDKALIALSSRMKFNVVFGEGMSSSAGWAITVADELKKMIKEELPKTIKDKKL